jgi:hypothetical protein
MNTLVSEPEGSTPLDSRQLDTVWSKFHPLHIIIIIIIIINNNNITS